VRRSSFEAGAALRTGLTLTILAAVSGVVSITHGGWSDSAPAVGASAAARQAEADRLDVQDLARARRSAAATATAAQVVAQRLTQATAQLLAQATAARREAEIQAARDAVRDPRGVARLLLADRGWGDQFGCLDALWTKESGWDYQARNPSSGASGIPQALPGDKMAAAGADWRTNPLTQIRWGLRYIAEVYGTPCGAWAHSRATNWY